MAQTIKLKRTSVQGKIPTTSNIELGELALNTYDGRIFFEKDNGVESIEEILTTNSPNTGSYNVGAISASNDITASNLFLSGNANIDGNVTLGGNITIGDTTSDSVIISAELSSSLIPDIHATFDIGSSSKKWNGLFVQSAFLDSASIGDVSLPGSNIVSSSAQVVSYLSNQDVDLGTGDISGSSFTGSFVGDGSGITGLQVDQVATVTSSFDNQSTINVTHNFDTRNVLVSVYDSSYNQLIPQTVSLTSADAVQVVLSAAHSGHVVVAKGGHVVSGSTAADNISGFDTKVKTKLDADEVVSGSGHPDHSTITLGSGKGLTGGGTIDVSRSLTLHTGSAHFVDGVVGATSYREDVSGASFYTITHSLDESYPFVQAWNTTNNTMELPIDVESTSANVITVSFSANFAGKIIVKK